MDFKVKRLRSILFVSLLSILAISVMVGKFSFAQNQPAGPTGGHDFSRVPRQVVKPETIEGESTPGKPPTTEQEDAAIEQQLDHDRQQQKQTKDLKIKLEQTNLELEQEKALAQINKLKRENRGIFDEPLAEGQKNLPEIKVDYIGGDSDKKEAIVSIGTTSYRVKEKSNLTAEAQVVSISDSSVTLHFSAPQDLTKTIDYKPQ